MFIRNRIEYYNIYVESAKVSLCEKIIERASDFSLALFEDKLFAHLNQSIKQRNPYVMILIPKF